MESSISLHDPRVQALVQILGDPTPTSTGELRFASPFHHRFKDPNAVDHKKHLYVNVQKGKFICFKSNYAGSLSYLFHLLGLKPEEMEVPVQMDTLDSLKSRLASLDRPVQFVRPTADLPDWYLPVQSGSEVHRYLRGRGVSDEDIDYYRLGEGRDDKSNWVVIPSLNGEGRCEYWVSRDVRRKSYLNPEVDRRYHVAFLHNALLQSPGEVTVCEGMFSAIAAGRDAVATLGKLVTRDQIRTMFESGVRRVNLALDGDAWNETLATVKNCLKMGLEVSVIPLPKHKDPNDLGREQFLWLKDHCTVHVDSVELLKLKLLT